MILFYDHSNHDAHQYAELRDIVDNKFIDTFWDNVFKYCTELPLTIKDKLYRFITDLTIKVNFNYNK